jgi:hypothetical protein
MLCKRPDKGEIIAFDWWAIMIDSKWWHLNIFSYSIYGCEWAKQLTLYIGCDKLV